MAIPTVDEVLENMNGAKVFSKIDLKWGYHQIELEPESRDITTFATHNGLYRYKRLIFGVTSASEQYQHEIAVALAGIEGAQNISDDIIVYGDTQETHDRALHAAMRRLRDKGLTVNLEKCLFGMTRLEFMGLLLSEKGIGPTEARVQAILDTRAPQTVAELRSFLGLATYSSRFIPRFSTMTEPLRRLLKTGAKFEFGKDQNKAFDNIKSAMAEATTLAYLDKNSRTKIIADASPVELGAVLVQEQNEEIVPISYASRSLTDTEQKYSQTEREALALVWACERFHMYVYGQEFDLITDHKPLQAIYGPRSKPSARIERWILRLQPNNYNVVYIPGSKNVADPLSRLLKLEPGSQSPVVYNQGADEYVRFIVITATPSALTTRQIEEASANDPKLDEVRKAMKSGNFQKCEKFAPIAGELGQIGHLVLRGNRIVMPFKLRQKTLSLVHEGHLGIVGTNTNLRTKVWWPGIDRDAEKFCRSCYGCQLVARPSAPEPLRPTELPDGPWIDLAADILGPLPNGESVLVLVDYYSRFYEIMLLRSTVTSKITAVLDEMFCRHGILVTIKTDNGPQFIAAEFEQYCSESGIEHLFTTARWAQASGEVERQNRSLEKRLRIAQAQHQDWRTELRKYLRQYRSLPRPSTGRSPAELLFRLKLRGKIPETSFILNDVETDTNIYDRDVRDRDAEQRTKSKIYTDHRRGAKPSEIAIGDQVLVQQEKTHKLSTNFNPIPYQVVDRNRSQVTVESPDGVQYRRNTSHLKQFIQSEPWNESLSDYRTSGGGTESTVEDTHTQPSNELSTTPPVPPEPPDKQLPNSTLSTSRPQREKCTLSKY